MAPLHDSASRVDRICLVVRRAIIERALAPGDKLPEDALGERFGVSRTIARQALGQLAGEGLVDLRRNRIAVVATPTFEEARDTFDIRVELERLVVRHLAGRLSADQIAELNTHIARQETAATGPEAASIRLATDFHVLLARMTGKPILIRYVSEVAYRSGLSLSAYGRPHSPECGVAEHRSLVDAMVEGDRDEAIRLMVGHLQSVAQRAFLPETHARTKSLIDVLAPYMEG
ncbi:GntR family transcriptional regulator [Fulvimarina sp. 2208YS6-2-32]|uniref:GntR family transcriptional regulator n=1 Tax=Fulvimarina uroteuthidis TaxID=3098149 RepID=A0ABU5I448_9HYPH|nr:GntR family transcriptional regulator [Fulvimarina sp. 2208YS6-2-32]MDY8110160.1 GntR family transcriptional regulator [Fulvimarina sp. 2208YS6-2-32]